MWKELLEKLRYIMLDLQLVGVKNDQFPFTLEVTAEVDPLTSSADTAIPQEVSVLRVMSYVDYEESVRRFI